MTNLEEYNLDTIKIAIAKQRDLLCQTSEKDTKLYDKRLDDLNLLMIRVGKLKTGDR